MRSDSGWAELWLTRIGMVLFAASLIAICLGLLRELGIWSSQVQAQQLADEIAAQINGVIKYGGELSFQLRGARVNLYRDGLELIQGGRSYFSEFISKVYLCDPSQFELLWRNCSGQESCLELETRSNLSFDRIIWARQLRLEPGGARYVLVWGE